MYSLNFFGVQLNALKNVREIRYDVGKHFR
jgi:hypothetical protein